MLWIDRVAEQAGPLTQVAQRFAQHHGVGLDRDAASCLKGLARSIERYESEDDRALIEGAGALLGVILIAHLNGRHVSRGEKHRCALGPLITFDPFAAIERVIDAEDVRRELAHQVQVAEAEARLEGPVSRVIRELDQQLETSGISHRISEVFDQTAWLGPEIEVDLSRIVEATQSGVPVARAVRRIVDGLGTGQGQEVVPWRDARERLLPRIVGAQFLSSLPRGGAALWSRALTPHIHVTLVMSYQRRARYVRNDEIHGWGVTEATAQREALQRLAARSSGTRLGRIETEHGHLVIAKTGDGLDSARVLLPGMHALLREELGEACWVALPHRDTLIACSEGPRALVHATRSHVEREARRAPHAISESLWRLTASGALEPGDC